jgi:two-component system, OmpR family, phosphate regulon response regulator PhoB
MDAQIQTVLIIEDDRDLADMVASYLGAESSLRTLICPDGESGLEMAFQCLPDLVLLDLRLPGMKGTEFCRRLRKNPQTETIPVIMLSACTEEIDRIVSLEVGADDYVTKPFSPRELLLRIQAVLRRIPAQNRARTITIGQIRIDREQYSVKVNGKNVSLSLTEFRLLATLAEHAGRVLSRKELMEMVGYDSSGATSRAIDVHITRLRAKLGEVGGQIRTVSGLGYTMNPDQIPMSHDLA